MPKIRISTVVHTLLGKIVEGEHGDRILGAPTETWHTGLARFAASHLLRPRLMPQHNAASRSRSQQFYLISSGRAEISSPMRWSFGKNRGRPGPASSPLAKRGWAGRSPTHYERSLREAASCRIATRCSTLRRQRRILLRCPCSISFADAGTELSIQIPRLGATWWNSENQERSRRLSNLTDLRFVE
jgi:hypothetical protein